MTPVRKHESLTHETLADQPNAPAPG
jgi:hypothetical protein